MYEDLDHDSFYNRWHLVKSRLDRSVSDFCGNVHQLVRNVQFSGASTRTIYGTPFQTFCTGRPLKAHDPYTIEWVEDERLYDEFDQKLEDLYQYIYSQTTPGKTRLTWRMIPSVGIIYPPTIEEVVKGAEYFALPRVYYVTRFALEDIVN